MQNDILVVEDEAVVQELVETILGSAGIPYRIAPDGAAAMQMARQRWSPVVLLDLTLPGGVDGWAVWDELSGLARGRPLHILLFTAVLDSEGELKASEWGAFAVVEKPVKPQALLEPIQQALGQVSV